MATYVKGLYSGVGDLVVYSGSNLDEIVSLVGLSNVEFVANALYVFGERVEQWDAVAMTDDVSPAPHAKIPSDTIHADHFQVEVVVYNETNLDAVAALIGNNFQLIDSTLYVAGVAVSSGDAVAKCCGRLIAPIAAAALASDYTVVT